MHISSLGALLSGALAALSVKDISCRMWDKAVGPASICPLITDTRPFILRDIEETLGSDLGYTLEDMPNVPRSQLDLQYNLIDVWRDPVGMPVPHTTWIENRQLHWWGMEPPNKWRAIERAYAESTRKWSETTDLVVRPPPSAFELAYWTKDLIVRPTPGELIVWVPPNTCPPGARPPPPPPPSLPPSLPSVETKDKSPVAKLIHTVYDRARGLASFESRRTVIGFYSLAICFYALAIGVYALIIGYLAIAALVGPEPSRIAWRGYALAADHIGGVSAVLGSVGRTLYRSMFLVTALDNMPTDAEVQRVANDDMSRLSERRDAARRDHTLMAGPRPIIAYDLANYNPLPHPDQRPLLVVFQNGQLATPPLAIPRLPMHSRTRSLFTVVEARAAPSSGPMTTASAYEDETSSETTLVDSKALLLRQALGMKLVGLRKSAVRRHERLRALRDEMGEEVALRHAQEGRAILRQHLRAMMGIAEQADD
ncbi:hypothetical protein DAEQUDRAFT_811758 [Daedalea quercina L-15889]|uniref:Uncharacterized protein n=1 Tax=Daedalea quercina L-15889 TaxID=1314783 RepID=A0A165Q112_9APHY|nr:hypothetical protein DAEQUDRAFT_811758 [Daedalea quercina L-15889]